MLLQRFRLRPFTETVILITQEREELHMKKIVLASASPRRRELLSQVGVAFEVKPASGEERITSAEPAKVVEELSRQKAMFTAYALEEEENRDLRDVVVIGADTVVSYEGKIIGALATGNAYAYQRKLHIQYPYLIKNHRARLTLYGFSFSGQFVKLLSVYLQGRIHRRDLLLFSHKGSHCLTDFLFRDGNRFLRKNSSGHVLGICGNSQP